ncbi:MAG: shikimate dehydrogenase [Methylobacteriaceae bacterium]|nr:shikimate dehydrogenase [Methylobacteriaceae bacterium]
MSHPKRFCLAGVMGLPVLHSRSPRLHNHWFGEAGMSGAYVPLEITPERLEAALRALPALGFAGCNLTIPHKVAAMAMVDEVDETARRIGAINCIVVRPDGQLHATNYDGFGFVESLVEAAPDWRADAGPAVVLGAGGGARAVVVGLADRGAKEIRVINRTHGRALDLAADLGDPVVALPWEARGEALADAATLVNTTSLGMEGQPELAMDLGRLRGDALVSDIVYIPRETRLLAAARARGNRTVNGLGMLIHQARPAFRDWFGVMPQATPALRAMIEATL